MAARLDTLEAENIVLAALMANPDNWELLQPQEEWFTETFSLAVLGTVKKLMAAGRTVDLVTVGQALKSDGIPQALSRVAQVQGYSVFDAESAAKSLKEAAARRRVSRRALELVELAENPLTQDGELWAAVEALAAMLQQQGEVDISPVGKIVEELWQSIKSRKVLTGQQTGFADLDRMIGGLRDGELVIIGARPGMGKTAFGLELLRRTSHPERPGIMFSLEMSRQNIAERLVTQATGLETRLLRAGTVPDWQLSRAETDVNPLYILPVYVTDKRQLKLHEIKAVCLKQQRQVGLGPIVVDYLTLMGEPQARGENRTALVERLAVGLQAMAMDLKAPVVVVSQLNRAVEMREDKRPTMADLRDSGGIEQAAHLVMLLYRPGYYYPKEEKYRNILEVIVAKQKDGPTGTVPLYFDLAKMHFADLARQGEA